MVHYSLTTYWTLQGTLKANRSISCIEKWSDGLKQIPFKMISKIPGYTSG